MQMKNHEGYHDPTAGKAIQRAGRSMKRREKSTAFFGRLTYQLREVPGFPVILK